MAAVATTRNDLASRPRSPSPERAYLTPRVDVYENTTELLVVADVPGASREGVDIHLEKDRLTIEARRDDAPRGEAADTGRAPTFYRRVFTVPEGIDESKIEAAFAAGVLRVTLPKSEKARPRRIEIKAS